VVGLFGPVGQETFGASQQRDRGSGCAIGERPLAGRHRKCARTTFK
jgi:hypothetical protein